MASQGQNELNSFNRKLFHEKQTQSEHMHIQQNMYNKMAEKNKG